MDKNALHLESASQLCHRSSKTGGVEGPHGNECGLVIMLQACNGRNMKNNMVKMIITRIHLLLH